MDEFHYFCKVKHRPTSEWETRQNMKIAAHDRERDFTTTDVYGNTVKLSDLKGQKVHLNFYRFSGCPFCNLRFHEINKLADLYREHDVALISVYESSAANMRSQMAGEQFYATMVPDERSTLYKLYDLDRSKLGLMSFLLFGGGLSQVMKGQKLFKQKVALDGHSDRIEAEFLIDADGTVVLAHYGERPGDYLPISTIRDFIING